MADAHRDELVELAVAGLARNAARLRALHHRHLVLDANARQLVAEVVVDVVLGQVAGDRAVADTAMRALRDVFGPEEAERRFLAAEDAMLDEEGERRMAGEARDYAGTPLHPSVAQAMRDRHGAGEDVGSVAIDYEVPVEAVTAAVAERPDARDPG